MRIDRIRRVAGLISILAGSLAFAISSASLAIADNQTATVSPIDVSGSLPYQISVQSYDFGAADLPTLQSYAAGVYQGKWVLIAGRTNGLHSFENSGSANFPANFRNQDVWVIDPISKQSWHRSLATDSSVTAQMLSDLTPANTEFTQVGDRLYMAGGYTGSGTTNALSAIDLPGLANWVISGAGQAANYIRQVHDNNFQVTGGAMYAMNGRMHLVFGQNFTGGYIPGKDGAYTQQVRSFDIVDNGTTLGFANLTSTSQAPDYRRRDLNVYPAVKRNPDRTLGQGLVALSGVFTLTNGAWTVPVAIDSNGNPTMADPNAPGTFKQGMNNYHSAKIGLFSESTNQMHEMLFGGISLEDYDRTTQTFVVDNNLPFINQITSIVADQNGNYSQHLLGEFPTILDQNGNRLRFGTDAEFFLAPGVPTYDNGVIKMDLLTQQQTIGYIFGGIFSNMPNTRGVAGAFSGASNDIFEMIYTPVPEPATLLLALAGVVLLNFNRRKWKLRNRLASGVDSGNFL
jgi:hypothetical protein